MEYSILGMPSRGIDDIAADFCACEAHFSWPAATAFDIWIVGFIMLQQNSPWKLLSLPEYFPAHYFSGRLRRHTRLRSTTASREMLHSTSMLSPRSRRRAYIHIWYFRFFCGPIHISGSPMPSQRNIWWLASSLRHYILFISQAFQRPAVTLVCWLTKASSLAFYRCQQLPL